ncbi:MAG: 3'-5' exonuclease, partial [Chlamydiia bacterium]|nr:3'-5' exonuclease [Chlamydiia bacterium]
GIFLDTETTGLCPTRHRTLELAMKIIDLATGEVKCSYHSVVHQPREVWEQSDPGALQVNGFDPSMVEEGSSEADVARDITRIFRELAISNRNAFFICQNPAHDRNFFGQLVAEEQQKERKWPYHWLDFVSMNWALAMRGGSGWDAYTPLSKDCIADRLGLPREQRPHRAMNGVEHLIELYQKVVGFPRATANV